MRRILPILVAGMLVAIVSYMAGLHAAHRAQAPVMAELQDAQWLKKELGLTDSQVATIGNLETAYRAQLATLCEGHCSARNELAEQLLRRTSRRETERALLDEMARVQVDTDAVTLEHIRNIRQVLTPDQRIQYDQLITMRLQTACPHHLHHGSMARTDGIH